MQKFIFEGRLGNDPELRYSAGGLAIVQVSIAVANRKKNDTGEYIDDPLWIRTSFFGKRAEFVNQWFKKGGGIIVEGKLQKGKPYQKKDSQEWDYSIDVIADDCHFVSGQKQEKQEAISEENLPF